MGAPDTYELPGSYNDGYRAMGDAVAVPVTKWLTHHLLAPIVDRAKKTVDLQTSRMAELQHDMTTNPTIDSRRYLDV